MTGLDLIEDGNIIVYVPSDPEWIIKRDDKGLIRKWNQDTKEWTLSKISYNCLMELNWTVIEIITAIEALKRNKVIKYDSNDVIYKQINGINYRWSTTSGWVHSDSMNSEGHEGYQSEINWTEVDDPTPSKPRVRVYSQQGNEYVGRFEYDQSVYGYVNYETHKGQKLYFCDDGSYHLPHKCEWKE